ncbi:MAG: pectate lyase [Isosphaeraceae bacterium]
MNRRWPAILLAIVALQLPVSPNPALAARADWTKLLRQPDDWYRSDAGKSAVASVLSQQCRRGDWVKNIDTTKNPYEGDRVQRKGTFDNGATVGETRFLAHAFGVTGDRKCADAVNRSFDLILASQYPTGGWPQSAEPGKKYPRYVTFNDGTMVGLMLLLRDVAEPTPDFRFLDDGRRQAARRAFDRGVDCIVKCQVKVGGQKTVWCAQHDEVTLEPRPARAFELVSLSGGESAGILLLLMGLKDPSPEVVAAVEAGIRWYEKSQIKGVKEVVVGGDKKMVADPNAPPIWARFYDIETNRPIFCGRDGVVKFSVAEIEAERRNGYAWYGNWGTKLEKPYARWKAGRNP